MGIWIRSQDKAMLLNVNGLSTGISSADARVFGRVENTDPVGMILGSYPTEAEAMQALDMIQRHIGEVEYGRYRGNVIDPVFQMPPAGFSQPSKEPAANMAKDLDLYKEALTIVLDSSEYVNCDNCPLREGCSRREATAICISDLRDYFLEEARESIAKAEGGGE